MVVGPGLCAGWAYVGCYVPRVSVCWRRFQTNSYMNRLDQLKPTAVIDTQTDVMHYQIKEKPFGKVTCHLARVPCGKLQGS